MKTRLKIKLIAGAALLVLSLTALANSRIVGAVRCPLADQIITNDYGYIYALGDWNGTSPLPTDEAKKMESS